MLECPDDFNREAAHIRLLKKTGNTGTDRPTDRPTDKRTDTTSYRDARTHLKMVKWGQFSFFRLLITSEQLIPLKKEIWITKIFQNFKKILLGSFCNLVQKRLHAKFHTIWTIRQARTMGRVRFLDASSHLYMRSCPSVCRSVGRSDGPCVTRFF